MGHGQSVPCWCSRGGAGTALPPGKGAWYHQYKASALQEKPQTPALSHPMVLGITHRVRLEGTQGLTCSHCPAHPRAPGTALCPDSSTQHGPGPTRAALGLCASSSHAGAQHQLKAATSFPRPRWDLPGRAAPSPVLTLITPRTDHIVSADIKMAPISFVLSLRDTIFWFAPGLTTM